MKKHLQHLPAIHELQKHEVFQSITDSYALSVKESTHLLQSLLQEIRQEVLNNQWTGAVPGTSDFLNTFFSQWTRNVQEFLCYRLRPVINATGTVLHTNLGRARLSPHAIQHVIAVAENYNNLELNLKTGKRGSRHDHIESLLKNLTGAEAAMVVNNNAAAVYLVLSALAKNKEVVVSRGELVEIGGSFRVSAIMEESGAILKEIGTTNKTHLSDYAQAIHEETAILMKVHTSNFKTIGFTASVEASKLVSLAKAHPGVIVYDDLGSGVLYDFYQHQIGEEPIVQKVIQSGVDLVSFSGDKLLGGPQAGIIVGKKVLIDQLKKHQLARVLRVDKMTLAALEATLLDYTRDVHQIPVLRDILINRDKLLGRASLLYARLSELLQASSCRVTLIETTSTIGGGTMPGVEIPSFAVSIQPLHQSVNAIKDQLRSAEQPILVRIQQDQILLDARTITELEIPLICEAFKKIFS